ncbi:MAG: NAD(P)H-hydrate dehydratase [Porticoccaceae bacterium]|nr:NAD(P)H-hydrate dehydratase [Porticoccaceae bacterium]MBT5576910.1 NAD(P)H-hydrate dehydratase [Porticoccaceae bacterium]
MSHNDTKALTNSSPADALYSTKTVREMESFAIHQQGMAGIGLMQRAGRAVFKELLDSFGSPSLLTVFCGGGNNAGDGYVVAALAAAKKVPVRVIELGETAKLSDDARLARQFAAHSQVSFLPFSNLVDLDEGLVVDALLGTGYRGQLRPDYAEAIKLINASLLPVVAIDIASGLNAGTGAIEQLAVHADMTVTFIGAKQGLFTGQGPVVSGEVIYDSLDVPDAVFAAVEPSAQLLDLHSLMECLPDLAIDMHKTQRGHSMVIGGDLGFGGAACLAAEASLKVGSGVTSVATKPQHVAAILARQPEIMVSGVVSGQELEPLLDRPSVLIVGPGMGRSPWSEQLLQKSFAAERPLVLDADALNIIAEGRVTSHAENNNWVLTPHAGEAAGLLGISVAEVQADRFSAVRQLADKYQAVVLLKGPGTLIAGPGQITKVCPYGNPAMATAGMGDLLSGIIGGLIAQGLDLQTATELGCCLHSCAADMAVQIQGQRGLVATDLLPHLRSLLNQEYL